MNSNSFDNARPSGRLQSAYASNALGPFPRFPVGGKHLRDSGGMSLRGRCEHLLNCTRDARKRNTTFEEGGNRNFISSIQGDAVRAALFRGLKGQAQAREANEVGLLKVQVLEGGQVESEVGCRAARDTRGRRGWAGACR